MEQELQTDIDQLSILSNDTILALLRKRYNVDEIYTWAGTTLVAVNPYKNIHSYYYQQSQQLLCDLSRSDEPHIYNVAENAMDIISKQYGDKCNASIIVSGESGSGKTESTKHLLRWLTVVKSRSSPGKRHAEHLEEQILAFNPVLESFGNACTSCNGNSSRFGKYIVLQFDSDCSLVGAHIQTYLLEKTRVVHQGENNFNFHIFYQFLSGISEEERDQYLVTDTQVYRYASSTPHKEYDCTGWQNLLRMWSDVGFTASNQQQICEILGAVLCLGNIEFVESDDKVTIPESSTKFVKKASQLLGLSSQRLSHLLLFRCISASHARRKSVFYKPCVLPQAIARRDCLAKLLYDRLFNFLVSHINSRIGSPGHASFIGLLDIYGFESFTANSLEQLCINYANERLQYYFVQYYLKDIQAEYEEQSIPWHSVTLHSDNESCVQVMSTSPGIFSILDEECQLNRLETQEVTHRLLRLNTHPNIKCTQKDVLNRCFTVHHYAASVQYSSASLIEKNMDLIPTDIVAALSESEAGFVSHLVADCSPAAKGKQQKKTVLSRFKHSLDGLIKKLRLTECQYVRCIKPNKLGKSAVFDDAFVSRQLAACGVLETVKIRSQTHAIRLTYESFLSTYKLLLPPSARESAGKENSRSSVSTPLTVRQRRRTLLPSVQLNGSPRGLMNSPKPTDKTSTPLKYMSQQHCQLILTSVVHPDMQRLISYGFTKIFIKNSQVMEVLEKAKNRKLNMCAFSIQCLWRRYRTFKCLQIKKQAAALIIRVLKKFVNTKRLKARLTKFKELREENRRQAERPGEFAGRHSPCKRIAQDIAPADETSSKYKQTIFQTSQHVGNSLVGCGDRSVFLGDRIVTIRHLLQVKIHIHIKAGAMLKNSHIAPRELVPSCSLLDCLEGR